MYHHVTPKLLTRHARRTHPRSSRHVANRQKKSRSGESALRRGPLLLPSSPPLASLSPSHIWASPQLSLVSVGETPAPEALAIPRFLRATLTLFTTATLAKHNRTLIPNFRIHSATHGTFLFLFRGHIHDTLFLVVHTLHARHWIPRSPSRSSPSSCFHLRSLPSVMFCFVSVYLVD